MKRNNGYMTPRNRKNIKNKYICAMCGKELEAKEAYCYVDENNCAITQNALPYCRECYRIKYGE